LAAIAVVSLGVLVALVAVGLSLLDVIRRIARPHDAVLSCRRRGQVRRSAAIPMLR
jgi:hypothetical protein